MAKESRLKTMFFAKDMRVIKDIYRENYDRIVWGKKQRGLRVERISPNKVVYKFK